MGRGILAALALLVSVMAGLPALAHASFPGTNGKIAFQRDAEPLGETRCTYTANSNGTGEAVLLPPCDPEYRTKPRWSPDGVQIAYEGWAGQLDLVNADGSNFREFFFDSGVGLTGISWSPDATELVVSWFDCFEGDPCYSEIGKVNATTGAYTSIHTTSEFVAGVDWSPDGTKIAFASQFQLYTIKPDGTNRTALVPGAPGENHLPSWAPDMSKIVFVSSRNDGIDEIYTVNPDGTGETRITNNFAIDTSPRWSPDGKTIIFESDRDDGNHEIYTMDASGTNQTRVTNNTGYDTAPDWQPIPVNSYVRPAGASPIRVSLVPAYQPCASPNRTHGTPLVHPSCNPPAMTSTQLTVGTSESNGVPAASVAFVRYTVVPGNTGTPETDEADVLLTVNVKDVRRQGTLVDYDGELMVRPSVRRTDRHSTPHPGATSGNGAATVVYHESRAVVPCTPTGGTVGATCALNTSLDALIPGIVTEGRRAIWELGQVNVDDGGADDDADTTGDNTRFMTQGVFVP